MYETKNAMVSFMPAASACHFAGPAWSVRGFPPSICIMLKRLERLSTQGRRMIARLPA